MIFVIDITKKVRYAIPKLEITNSNKRSTYMCQEVLKIVQGMDRKHIGTQLAIQCAPLITGIKMSNLLIVSSADAENVPHVLRRTGLAFVRLSQMKHKVTFLLFRRKELGAYLQDLDVQQILQEYGYEDLSFQGIMQTFVGHYQTYVEKEAEFPHEMGLLLGYPVEDVRGFIVHKGQNFLYSGYWKVYADVTKKQEMFRQYEEAQRDVVELLAGGTGICQIIKIYNGRNQIKLAV